MTTGWENAVLSEKVKELIRNVLASSPDEVIPDEVIYVGDPSLPLTEDEIAFAQQLEREAGCKEVVFDGLYPAYHPRPDALPSNVLDEPVGRRDS